MKDFIPSPLTDKIIFLLDFNLFNYEKKGIEKMIYRKYFKKSRLKGCILLLFFILLLSCAVEIIPKINKFNPPSWIYGTYQDSTKNNIYCFTENNIVATITNNIEIDFDVAFSKAEVKEEKTNVLYKITIVSKEVNAMYKFEYITTTKINYTISNNGITVDNIILYLTSTTTTTTFTNINKGNLIVKMNLNMTRTILPNFIDMDHYEISGKGPYNNSFEFNNIIENTYTISSLLTGNWDITVLGKDVSNDTITRGIITTNIIEDQTTDVNITLNYLQEGYGKVDFKISWPISVLIDSVIFQIDNEPNNDIYISGNNVKYTNNSIKSGFYLFKFKFMKNGLLIAGVLESVHIYDFLTSSTEINLNMSDMKLPPSAPTNLTVTKDTGKIILNWADNSDTETGFVVERSVSYDSGFVAIDGTDITPLNINTMNYEDTNVVSGTTYYYKVKAINSYGSSEYSNTDICDY